jgi:hypothetical protein
MRIGLKKFGTTLISRELGSEAFRALQPTLQELDDEEILEVDFSQVLTISPSWADEFLTPLLKRFGKRLILLKSGNLSVKETIKILEKANECEFQIR